MNVDPRIEAAAKMLWEASPKGAATGRPYEGLSEAAKEQFRRLVRAVVAAADSPAILTTIEQVDSLSPGSVVLDAEGTVWKRGTGSWVGTADRGDLEPRPSGARVLHFGSAH